MLVIKTFIEKCGDCGFIAYTDKFKGLVVHGDTLDEVKRELRTSLEVKIAFDYKLDIKNPNGQLP